MALRSNGPIFVPSLGDRSWRIGIWWPVAKAKRVMLDQIRDLDEITQIVERSPKTGVIYIGGGIPKNYFRWHSYAIKYTTCSL